ncbi:MAG: SpoIID/LytB domain-containing protein [Propionibacteriales bacterium]|nr:SpoIID/LytB domain-containing protein [Propionibacteriales bacterium]
MIRLKAVLALGVVSTLTVLSQYAAPASKAAGQVHYVPVDGEGKVMGHGYGHGHGMSQYGAEGAARAGKSYRRILSFYYPGTNLGGLKKTRLRVLITADTTSDVKVSPARGLRVRDRGLGQTWTLPRDPAIDRWRIMGSPDVVQFHRNGNWRTWTMPNGRTRLKGVGEFRANVPIKLWVPVPGGEVSKRYRGSLRSVKPSAGANHRDTVNVVGIDRFVRGVVSAEMPASWSQRALRAQAVAARTYAIHERNENRWRYYDTCDSPLCQVYNGVGAETEPTDRAVRATRRQILRYDGRAAFTQFTASSGGRTSYGGRPYLPTQRDPWDDWPGNSVHDWTTRIDTGRLERRYPSLGNLISIDVFRRTDGGEWGGRVARLRLNGSQNDVRLSGEDFRSIYGMRSTWFTFGDTATSERRPTL